MSILFRIAVPADDTLAPVAVITARQLAALMQSVTGEPPVVWGGNIVGFGQYRVGQKAERQQQGK